MEPEGLRLCEHRRGDQHARLGDIPDERASPAVRWQLIVDRTRPLGRTQASRPPADLRSSPPAPRRPFPVRREVPAAGGRHGPVPPERAGPGRAHLQTGDQRPEPVLRVRRGSRGQPAVCAALGVPRRPPPRAAHPPTHGERAGGRDRQGAGHQPAARFVPSPMPRKGRARPTSWPDLSSRDRPTVTRSPTSWCANP